jgi:hypothetical protein
MYHLILIRLIQMYQFNIPLAPDDPLDPAIKTVPTLPTQNVNVSGAGLSSSIVSVVPDIM